MNRVPIADWAAIAPWSGLSGKPSWAGTSGPVVDQANVVWGQVGGGNIPYWNGTRFVPVYYSPGSSSGGGTTIDDGAVPGIAVLERPPGDPYGEPNAVWRRYVYNVRQYGAIGNGGNDDSGAVNAAIYDLTQAGGGTLYFPAGYYRCPSVNLIGAHCLVKGDGIGISTIECDGNDGLSFAAGTAQLNFGIQDLSIEQTAVAYRVESGRLLASGLGIDCTSRGFQLGEESRLLSGYIRDVAFFSYGTAIAIEGAADQLDMGGLHLLGNHGAWRNGIHLTAGTACILRDSYFSNITNAAVVWDSLVSQSRATNLMFKDVLGSSLFTNAGQDSYINELFGLGGNTDTRFEDRKELYSIFSWSPGTVAPGYGYYDDFSVPGTSLGDQVIAGVPKSFPGGVSIEARAQATDTVRLQAMNLGTAVITLDSPGWKLRVFN